MMFCSTHASLLQPISSSSCTYFPIYFTFHDQLQNNLCFLFLMHVQSIPAFPIVCALSFLGLFIHCSTSLLVALSVWGFLGILWQIHISDAFVIFIASCLKSAIPCPYSRIENVQKNYQIEGSASTTICAIMCVSLKGAAKHFAISPFLCGELASKHESSFFLDVSSQACKDQEE